MNGRPAVREAIIRKKILHWKTVVFNPSFYRDIPPSQARKNFWRLIARYPQVAARLHVDEASVY